MSDACPTRRKQSPRSFGHRMHFCPGASLGRAGLQVAFAGLLRRTVRLRLDDAPLERRDGLVRRLVALPIHAEV